MAVVVRVASLRAGIAQTATAALTAHSTLGLTTPRVRIGGVRVQNNMMGAASLTAPVHLGATVQVPLGGAGLVAPVSMVAAARTGTAPAVVRVGAVRANLSAPVTGTLHAPVVMSASTPFALALTAPVSLVYHTTATARASYVAAIAPQSVYDWNGTEWVPRPASFLVAPVALVSTAVDRAPGASALTAPVALGSSAARVTPLSPAALTAPVGLGSTAVDRIAPAAGLTAAVSLSGNLTPTPIQVATTLSAPVALGSSLSGQVPISASLFAAPVSLVALSVGIPLGQGLLTAPVALSAGALAITSTSVGMAAPVFLVATSGSLTTGTSSSLAAPVVLSAAAVNSVATPTAMTAPVVVGASSAVTTMPSVGMTAEIDLGAQMSSESLMTAPVQLTSTVSTPVTASLSAASSLTVDDTLVQIIVNTPIVPMPNAQPFYVRQVQDWAIQQERQRHVQALYMVGEPAVFVMMWKVEDFEAGLVARCSRCGPTDNSVQSRIFAVYDQPLQALCPVCFGTTFQGGVRARIVRPAIFTDADEDERKNPRGAVHAENLMVESTNDFRTRTGDYVFRTDGSRYQLGHPERVMLRTGYNPPTQREDSLGYARIPASREDRSSVAYIIPPTPQDVTNMLTVPYQFPSVVPDYTPGPLIPDLVSTAGEFE